MGSWGAVKQWCNLGNSGHTDGTMDRRGVGGVSSSGLHLVMSWRPSYGEVSVNNDVAAGQMFEP